MRVELVPVQEKDREFLRRAVARIELPEYVDQRVDIILSSNADARIPLYYRNAGEASFYVGGFMDNRDVFHLETSSIKPTNCCLSAVLKQYLEIIQSEFEVLKFKAEVWVPRYDKGGSSSLERVLKKRLGFTREGYLRGEGFDPVARTRTDVVSLAYFPRSRRAAHR